jgi:asparagine synthetase B (glutamine-hydrolysing)
MSEISSFPVETFTIGFKDKAYDERDLAREVAVKFGTNHHEYIIEPSSFEESLNSQPLITNVIHNWQWFGDKKGR